MSRVGYKPRRECHVATCDMCRKPFYRKNKNKRTCSDRCRKALSRWNRSQLIVGEDFAHSVGEQSMPLFFLRGVRQ